MRRIFLLLIWTVLCVGLAVTAAESTQEQTHKWDSLRSKPIYFRLESSIIDSSFGKNDEALQQLGFIFTDITTISRLNSVRITATTSPDGNPAYNRILAFRRVKTVKNYIEQNYPYMDQNKIVTYGYVENWMRLRPMISKQTPNYLQIVSILDQQPTPQATESHLRTIDGGKAWGEIPTSTQPTFLIEETCIGDRGYYDVEWDNKGYQGEFCIPIAHSEGYAHQIGRNLSMAYSLRVGYMRTSYRKYAAEIYSDGVQRLIRQRSDTFN